MEESVTDAINYIQDCTGNHLTDEEIKNLRFFALESDDGKIVWSSCQAAKIHDTCSPSTLRKRIKGGYIDTAPLTDGKLVSHLVTKNGIVQVIRLR